MTITPPPPPLPPRTEQTPKPPARIAPRVIGITAIALGAVVVLVTGGTAVAASIVSASTQTTSRTLDVAGMERLVVDASASEIDVLFADVDEAQLEVTAAWGSDLWRFDRDGDDLVLASPRWIFGIGWLSGGDSRAVLTLPESLREDELDADLTLSAGELDVEGDFASLEIDVSAGRVEVVGSAEELQAVVSAGRADLDLAGVEEAELSISAGDLVARLSGRAPETVSVQVSAGSARLTLPDETYDVSVDVSAGGMDNGLSTSSTSTRKITGEVSAGNLVLRPGD